jgi:hypothetical protein
MYKKWSSYSRPVAVSIDASRFDQHCSVDILDWEHSLYNGVFRDAELAQLLQWQLYNEGVSYQGDKKIVYKTVGCRMSGDMNTGMGNCIIMCGLVYSYLEQYGIDAKLLNNGDDCVLFMNEGSLAQLATLPAWFLNRGFTMIVEPPSYELEHVDFCQTRTIYTDDGYRAVRDPRTSIAKDLLATKMLNAAEIRAQRGAVASGGLALASDLPVIGAMYRWMDSGVRGARSAMLGEGFKQLSAGCRKRADREPSGTCRASFCRAFGISPAEQRLMESWFINNPFECDVDVDWTRAWWNACL